MIHYGRGPLPEIDIKNAPPPQCMAYTKAQGYKLFFVLNSTEQEISTAHKN